MRTKAVAAPNEMEIFRRIVETEPLNEEAARAILRLDFSGSDRDRMNVLAARNRETRLSVVESEELENYARVGQNLGILQSKARQSLRGASSAAKKNRRT